MWLLTKQLFFWIARCFPLETSICLHCNSFLINNKPFLSAIGSSTYFLSWLETPFDSPDLFWHTFGARRTLSGTIRALRTGREHEIVFPSRLQYDMFGIACYSNITCNSWQDCHGSCKEQEPGSTSLRGWFKCSNRSLPIQSKWQSWGYGSSLFGGRPSLGNDATSRTGFHNMAMALDAFIMEQPGCRSMVANVPKRAKVGRRERQVEWSYDVIQKFGIQITLIKYRSPS